MLVKGARQMGKTSLLARGLAQACKEGRKVVVTDFQMLNTADLQSGWFPEGSQPAPASVVSGRAPRIVCGGEALSGDLLKRPPKIQPGSSGCAGKRLHEK